MYSKPPQTFFPISITQILTVINFYIPTTSFSGLSGRRQVVEVKMFDARDPTTGRVVVVAVYDPPGNIRGTYASNVPPPRDISIC